jgi:polar amino acid transport system substrate-binding protein
VKHKLDIVAFTRRVFALAACLAAACALVVMPSSACASTDTVAIPEETQRELLESASIGVRVGSISAQTVAEEYPEADIQNFTSTPDIVNAVLSGKIQYGAIVEPVARAYMRQNQNLTYMTPVLYEFNENLMVQKGNDELKEKLNGALSEMRESGELESIYDKWVTDGNYDMSDVPVVEDGPVLKVACCATTEPKIFIQDNECAGYDAEIIMRVAYKLGYKVEFQDMAFNAELASVATGKSDVGISYSRTEEREKEVDFTDAYTKDAVAIITTKDQVSDYVVGSSTSDSYATGLLHSVTKALGSEDAWKLIVNFAVILALAVGLAFALHHHGHTKVRRAAIWGITLAIGIALAATSFFIDDPARVSAGDETDTLELTEEKRDELLSKSSVGVQLGGLVEIIVNDNYPTCDKQVYESIADTVVALGAGKIDYACVPDCMARLYMRQNSNYTYLEPELYEVDSHIGLKKGSELKDKIDAAIKQLKQDGTIDEVYNKWVVEGNYDMSDVEIPTEGETITVAYHSTSEPMMFLQNDEPAGCDIELAYRIAKIVGVQINWVDLPLTSELASLSAGKIDAALNLAYTDERAKEIDFSVGTYAAKWVAMTTRSNTAAVEAASASDVNDDETTMTVAKQYEMLQGKTIATAEGSPGYDELAEKLGSDSVTTYSSDEEAAAALADGKADYASVSETYAALFQRSNSGYVRATPCHQAYDSCFAVSKDNAELKEKIDTILQRMTDDGTIDKLHKKWVSDGDYDMSDVPKNTTGPALRVAVTTSSEPLSFIKDGEHVGLDCEVIERVAYELGMQVEYYEMDSSAEISAVASSEVDVACALTPTDELEQEADFTIPYFTSGACILMKSASADENSATIAQSLAESFENTFITESRWKLVVNGLGVTLAIALGSFVLATVAGAGLCAASRSKRLWLRGFAKLYDKLASGIPVLVWLMVTYYVIFAGVDISSVLVAILTLGLVAANSIAGVFKTGLGAVDQGEVEACVALGFSRRETFLHVILPQAAQHVWSLYAGEFTGLIKSTSIVGYVAISDLTKASDIIRSRTFEPFFPLIATALVYFVVIAIASWLFGLIAKRIDPKRRSEKRVLRGINR